MMTGKYLNSHPYSDQVYGNIAEQVLPSVNSQFSGAGRYGSDLHADTATRALTQAYSPFASQQYQQGLDRMTTAANNFAPEQALEGIGQQRQGLAQNEIQAAQNRYNFYQDLPAKQLSQYMGFSAGDYGGNRAPSHP